MAHATSVPHYPSVPYFTLGQDQVLRQAAKATQ